MSTIIKRSLILSLLSVSLLFIACSKTTSDYEAQSNEQAPESPVSSVAPASTANVSPPSVAQINESIEALYEQPSSLLELGKILSSEMADGYFDYVTKLFADNMNEVYCIESLLTFWNETVKDYGQFLGLTDAIHEDNTTYDTIFTILQYEHKNLLVGLTFNKDQQITNFSLNDYATTTFHKTQKEP